jgi:hypothetical protein
MTRSLFRFACTALCLWAIAWARHPIKPSPPCHDCAKLAPVVTNQAKLPSKPPPGCPRCVHPDPRPQPSERQLAPKQISKLTKHFDKSASKIQSAEKQIQKKIDKLQAQKSQTPEVKEQIASLQQSLARVRKLETQADTVRRPISEKLTASGAVTDSESTDATQKMDRLVTQAQTEANNAGKVSGAETGGGGSTGGGVPAYAPAPVPTPAPVRVPAPEPAPAPDQLAPPASGEAPGAAAPNPAAPNPAAPANDTDEGLAAREQEWFGHLKNGLLQHNVPPVMEWKIPSTVTVTVSGERAAPEPLEGASGQAKIKVARKMIVRIFSPDAPDEFTFTPEGGTQEERYVPEDGTTTWQWAVTPNYTAKQQTIVIRAWVVFSDKNNVQQELPVYTAPVQIQLKLGTVLLRLIELDPNYWLKYGLPGGGGFVFVSGILIGFRSWWNKRKKPPATAKGKPRESEKQDEPDLWG